MTYRRYACGVLGCPLVGRFHVHQWSPRYVPPPELPEPLLDAPKQHTYNMGLIMGAITAFLGIALGYVVVLIIKAFL